MDYLLRENDQLGNCEESVWSPKTIKVTYQTLIGLKLWQKLAEKSKPRDNPHSVQQQLLREI